MKLIITIVIAAVIAPLSARAESPVLRAAFANDLPALQSAMVEGDVNAAAANGATALHAAAAYGYDGIVAALVAAGAQVDARDHLGNTPLILAAQEGHAATVRRLLEAGADRSARSIAGGTAASYAGGYGHHEIAGLLTPPAPAPTPAPILPVVAVVLTFVLTGAITYELRRSVGHRLSPVTH